MKILITGAGGNIGRALRSYVRGAYELVRLADMAPQEPARNGEEIVTLDIREFAQLSAAMKDIDCVVHLAGIPGEDTWEKILSANIEGCYNLFEAARVNAVKRVVFASSNHAVGFHRRSRRLTEAAEPRPDTRYGVSKVFGEALGRFYADKYGLSVASLRIGTFRTPDRPSEARQLLSWVSHRDLGQLVRRCIDYPAFHYLVAYGVSNNRRSQWSNDHVDFLGYKPEDDSELFAAEILARNEQEDPVASLFHGGFYCPIEFAGDVDRID